MVLIGSQFAIDGIEILASIPQPALALLLGLALAAMERRRDR